MHAAATYLIAGLGNPGPRYQFDRHNVGFMVGEELCRRHGFPKPRSRFQGLTAEGSIGGCRAVILLPMTFMNLSGKSVAEAVRFFKVPSDTMLIVHDEVELAFGDVRLKEGGGLGGHNGLRSLEEHLRTRDFWRLRVGVGRPASGSRPLADYVLEPFIEPREEVLSLVERAADLAEEWLAAQDGGACPA
ncbi:MAG: aminoacyl-tRNA hydrolase [Actinobacteria bacterium]|nr:aminoacyl-tRNA hydrolase [Actinomycetota bacterium]